jgi:hypothetical protein
MIFGRRSPHPLPAFVADDGGFSLGFDVRVTAPARPTLAI